MVFRQRCSLQVTSVWYGWGEGCGFGKRRLLGGIPICALMPLVIKAAVTFFRFATHPDGAENGDRLG